MECMNEAQYEWTSFLKGKIPLTREFWETERWIGENVVTLWYGTQVLRYMVTGGMKDFFQALCLMSPTEEPGEPQSSFSWPVLMMNGYSLSDQCVGLMKCIESCNDPRLFLNLLNVDCPLHPLIRPSIDQLDSIVTHISLQICLDVDLIALETQRKKAPRIRERLRRREEPTQMLCHHKVQRVAPKSGQNNKAVDAAEKVQRVVLAHTGAVPKRGGERTARDSKVQPLPPTEEESREINEYLNQVRLSDETKGPVLAQEDPLSHLFREVTAKGEIGQYLSEWGARTLYKKYDATLGRIKSIPPYEALEVIDYGCRSVLAQMLSGADYDRVFCSTRWPERRNAVDDIASEVVSRMRLSSGVEPIVREMHNQVSKIYHRLVSQGSLGSESFGDLSIPSTLPQVSRPTPCPVDDDQLSVTFSARPPFKSGYKIVKIGDSYKYTK
uniref:Glycoprotein n=1 Tax=Guadeloupe mosquito mononega-like virus TaxID=2607732 RepID=A0A5C1K2Y0_9MONO|nr:glycoprotein [Guadeloupe mosquito mononega-like virus]